MIMEHICSLPNTAGVLHHHRKRRLGNLFRRRSVRITTPFILVLLLMLGCGSSAWARLGESEAEVIQRLGKPYARQHFTWCDKDNFSVNGFTIVVTLINGLSVGEAYHITSGNLTDSQIVDLLDANCEGFSWDEIPQNKIPKDIFHPIKQMWQRPNGSTAVSFGSSIEFKSIFLILAEQDANKPPPAPSTAGF